MTRNATKLIRYLARVTSAFRISLLYSMSDIVIFDKAVTCAKYVDVSERRLLVEDLSLFTNEEVYRPIGKTPISDMHHAVNFAVEAVSGTIQYPPPSNFRESRVSVSWPSASVQCQITSVSSYIRRSLTIVCLPIIIHPKPVTFEKKCVELSLNRPVAGHVQSHPVKDSVEAIVTRTCTVEHKCKNCTMKWISLP